METELMQRMKLGKQDQRQDFNLYFLLHAQLFDCKMRLLNIPFVWSFFCFIWQHFINLIYDMFDINDSIYETFLLRFTKMMKYERKILYFAYLARDV